jgi:hypothetical protein
VAAPASLAPAFSATIRRPAASCSTVFGLPRTKPPPCDPPYAKKIEDLARAKGLSVTVVQEPKPTPAECKAAVEGFNRWLKTCGIPVEEDFES